MILYIDSFAVPRFGPVVVSATANGLRFLTFGPKAVAADAYEYAAKYKMETAENNEITNGIKEQLQQYFAGKRREFEIDLDIEHLEEFTKAVLKAALAIPYGQTITYGELARRTNSTAYRATGRIMANNPIPIVIPCHRVVGEGGKLTGFALGLEIKRKLLDFESSQLQLF